MALRKLAPPRTPGRFAPEESPDRSVAFVRDGQQRRVDLGAPRSVRRGRRRMVQLIDLWVATLLPGDFLDLRFELTMSEPGGGVRHSAPLDALHFARGFVTRPGRILHWEEPADSTLNGLRLEAVVVHAAATPLLRIVPPPAPAPKLDPARAMRPLDLCKLLPNAVSYPQVQWRSVGG